MSIPPDSGSPPEHPSSKNAPSDHPSLLGLNLDEIRAAIVEHLALVPNILMRPRATLADRLEMERPLSSAVTFALVLFVLSASAAAALGLGSTIEGSSVAYLAAGVVTSWIIYAVFLHGFAFAFGARRGVDFTLVAYLYVMGALQPVLVMILSAITWLAPDAVTYQQIRALGGSGAGQVLAEGNFLHEGWDALVRLLAGVLILVYFALALVPAQRISPFRAGLASAASFVFFFIVYMAISLVSSLSGVPTLTRLFLNLG